MTQDEIFNALANGGAYSLPYLIKMHHPTAGTLYFVNNNESVDWDGHTFQASAFNYTPPQTIGGVLKNGSLEITAIKNNVINLIDQSDELFEITAVGALNEDGTVTAFKMYRHQYGSVTITEDMRIVLSFTNDDRLEMAFPPYIFDSDNNRGNA